MIGKTLSHYRVTAALGAGGMGEVYRATDLNLGRDVALKVLPPEVAQDGERLERFRREAHLLAALNHPHIASIYGLEAADGKPFLVLELVEGEDLRQRLDRGAIPVDDALEIAEQIAEALEEAHGKGIVHRDLKPANVKVTPDGNVKVLDFGLAKAWDGDPGGPGSSSPSSALSQSPTLARTGTVAGVILGTAAYMSPEQARGKPVDKRSDVWSFGVLLWEMLTGRSLFAGETVTDIIASVVKEDVDLDALPADTPPAVRRLVERCLRKDARARLPDAGAARLELQDLLAGASTDLAVEVGAAVVHGPRAALAWGLSATLGVLLAGLAFVHLSEKPAPPPPPGRFVVAPPDGWAFANWGWPAPSPDGSQILFRAFPVGTNDGSAILWLRPLGALEARPLSGTEGAGIAFWSPDGRSIAFAAGSELRRLDLATGTVQRITTLPGSQFAGGDWREDGLIVVAAGEGRPDALYTVPAAGGQAAMRLSADREAGEDVLLFPQFLGSGRVSFAGVRFREAAVSIYATSLSDPPARRVVFPDVNQVQLVGERVLLFRDGTLLAQRFDPDGLRPVGEAIAVATSVGTWEQNHDIAWFRASEGGTLAYLTPGLVGSSAQLTWFDRRGNPVGTVGPAGSYGQIALSRDERQLALEIQDSQGRWDIWVMDVTRGVTSRVTSGEHDERNPVWSPDGRYLAFSTQVEADRTADLRRKGLRAGDPETVLVDTDQLDYPEAWSADGSTLLFVKRSEPELGAEQSVWAFEPGGDADPEPVLNAGFFVDEPQLSPDERWLAYNSHESGRSEVYVEPFRREGERVRVSVDGGGQPKWRGDGRELFYTTLDGRLMSVVYRGEGDRPEVELPVVLFDLDGIQGPDYDDYAPSADGQRFLVKRRIGEDQPAVMHVVTNWPSLLPETR